MFLDRRRDSSFLRRLESLWVEKPIALPIKASAGCVDPRRRSTDLFLNPLVFCSFFGAFSRFLRCVLSFLRDFFSSKGSASSEEVSW